MNKISKLLLGVAALGMWSCSNDEPNNDNNVVEGDVAYLNVNIIAAGNMSRGGDGGFQYGKTNENAVNSAYFFFYDENGDFVTESNTWASGEANTETPDKNIEYFGENTVVLEGLTGKEYPTWVVTVLNKPASITAKRTIKEMSEQLLDYKNGDLFVMSTTSYFGDDNKAATSGKEGYYFATRLNKKNFYPNSAPALKGPAVDIYVERLAARVQVEITATPATTAPSALSSYTVYEVPVTIAGMTNAGSGTTTAAEKVYVQFQGWELNAHAKQTSLSKSLEGWSDATTWANSLWQTATAWNSAGDHRSYWGKSTTYDLTDNALKDKLEVGNHTWSNLSKKLGTTTSDNYAYCNETTNIPANISDGNIALPNTTPTVILKAQLYDADGEKLDIVNFLGINFIKAGFLRKVLDIKKTEITALAYYYKEVEGSENHYFPLDETCLKLVAAGKGTGTVDAQIGDKTLYTISGASAAITHTDGRTYYTATVETEVTNLATINSHLKDVTATSSTYATAYTNGAAYYAVPLEHLNKLDGTAAVGVAEGQYGVVRNHIYSLSISNIKSIGDGVFEPGDLSTGTPGENINPTEPKDPTFYVESQVNILAWKVVTQEAKI